MTPASQADTIAFLSRGAAYGEPNAEVERIETHISVIFLVGSRVFKLKRAVAFSYLDFSSVASRRRACEAEFALGRRMSPTLYHAVRRVTRGLDGGFALDGEGAPVDFLVEMRRFGQDALFDHMAEHGKLDPAMMRDLADAIAAFHAAAEPAPDGCTPDAISALIGDVAANLAAARIFTSAKIEVLRSRLDAELKANRVTIERRRAEGRVRRCHGDLHLRNICFVDGKPMLFDPIEFSAALAAIDTLYDLAFLLMDLIHRGRADFANLVFNRYLDRTGDVAGLGLLPLYLALRAAIRAHVSVAAGQGDAARNYLRLAWELLGPAPPALIAIGGFSGTGKTTLAQRLAPEIGRAPGARLVRSDVIRKQLHGVTPEQRLPGSAYDATGTAGVYEALRTEALTALAAGQGVIADATFLRLAERDAIEAVARAAGVAFTGLWLEAPSPVLKGRLSQRQGDASDADAAVLRDQLRQELGAIGWQRIAAGGDLAAAAQAARARIGR